MIDEIDNIPRPFRSKSIIILHFSLSSLHFLQFFWGARVSLGDAERKLFKAEIGAIKLSCQNWKANTATKIVYLKKWIGALSLLQDCRQSQDHQVFIIIFKIHL